MALPARTVTHHKNSRKSPKFAAEPNYVSADTG
jgi:hypothetical protein